MLISRRVRVRNDAIVVHYLPGYEPYVVRNGLWEKSWPRAFPVLEKDWKPYLDGGGEFGRLQGAMSGLHAAW